MNLRTRITAAVVASATIGTLIVGGIAIWTLRTGQIGVIDDNLRSISAQIAANGADPVSEASYAVDDSAVPAALAFVAPNIGTVWLRTLPALDIRDPDVALVERAIANPVTTPDGFRIASVPLPDGEHLVIASSLAAINQESRNNIMRMLLIWLPFNALLAIVITFLVGRNVRQMEQLVVAASSIAAGAADVDFSREGSSSEARRLAQALDQLVVNLQRALESERASNQRMQEFLGDASHELRTPLTVIKGYLELLERPDGLQGDQQERALDRMRTEAGRMEVLVNDLLLLAEIGSTQQEDFAEVDLTGLLRVMCDDLRTLQPERDVTTSIESDITMRAVASHLHRAIANAMANIRRHTPMSAPVRVVLHATPSEVQLVIEDGGPGLSPEHYAQGIGHFQRFDRSRSRTTGGSGLGMSIMAAVVDELGGTVRLQRSSLGGLSLDFRFPRDRA